MLMDYQNTVIVIQKISRNCGLTAKELTDVFDSATSSRAARKVTVRWRICTSPLAVHACAQYGKVGYLTGQPLSLAMHRRKMRKSEFILTE